MANELPNTPALVPAPLSGLPRPTPALSSNDILASTVAGAVERQITKYLASMSQQVEEVRESAQAARHEMRSDFAQQLDLLTARVDANQIANERYQSALQAALEERLAEFANHQHQTLTKVNAKLANLPALVQTELPAHFAEISQGLRDYLEHKVSAVETQIDELHKANHRFDDQVGAIVQNINETVTALSRRMDDGDEALSKAVDQRLGDVRGLVDQTGADVARQLAEHGQILSQRVDTIDMKMVDRALAMEERINENNGTKIANLEANIGRVGSAFDEAMGALSRRIVDIEVMVLEAGDRIDGVAADMTKVDEEAINAVKEQLSSAVGEAMLVRIEVDRFMASQEEKFDSTALRMAEIEAQLADSMDVGEAVQLERLEEIERALLELDPNQFVRKVEQTAGGGSPSPSVNPTLPAGGAYTSSEANLASY